MGTITPIYNVRVNDGKSRFNIAAGGYQVERAEAERIIAELMADPTHVMIALFLYGTFVKNEHGKWFFLNEFLPNHPRQSYHRPVGKMIWCVE